MARLHDGSDEDLPDLSTVIAHYAKTDSWRSFVNTTISADRQGTAQEIEPETGEDGRKQCSNQVVVAHRPRTSDEKTVRDDSHEKRRVRRQRPLGVVRLNTVLLPQASTFPQPTNRVPVSARAIPRRTLELTIDSRDRTLRQSTPLCLLEDDPSDFASASFTREVSDTGRAQRQKRLRKQTERLKADSEEAVDGSTVVLPPSCSIKATAGKASQTTLSSEPIQAANRSISDDSFKMHTVSTSGCEHAFESEPSATLRYSPPRLKSPCKLNEGVRFTTPPPSPSKARLQSPRKQQMIPPSPHRPSIDDFWSQDVINDWNDEYSQRKVLRSDHRRPVLSVPENGDEEPLPLAFPPRSPTKTPLKRNKKAFESRRAFTEKNHGLALDFLKELDDTIANGKVASLAAPTGGIRLIWSKTLNSTAGRANWRQEIIKSSENNDGLSETYRHHASIELAEKVIDDEGRLINVIAHEYCHLANFMISGVKNNPHGKQFKEWAKRCSQAFRHRGVEVTTKHSYIIDYKYIWECTNCGQEFKRHSKSIDPARHTCGSCTSKLVQTQPTPRTAVPSNYNLFIKSNFQQTKKAHPESSQKELMGLLGQMYKEQKAAALSASEVRTDVEVIDVEEEKGVLVEDDEGDSVSRTLDFLSLVSQ